MQAYHNKILNLAAQNILDSLKLAFPESELISQSEIYFLLGSPPDNKMGHLAFPCFTLSKKLKISPVEIAKKIKEHFKNPGAFKTFLEVGPYFNFFFNSKTLGELVGREILSGEFFNKILVDLPQTLMVEYSQPNTHKELHVGHMRNLCLGNAIVRLNRYTKNTVYAVTYPGDVGTHVAKCLWYLKHINKTPAPDQNKGAWLGEMYSKAHNLLEDQRSTEKEEQNRLELTAILKQLENKKGEYYDLWKITRQWSIDQMKQIYAWADITFDRWFFESECDRPSLEMAKKLHQEGKLIVSDGATGMDLSENKLGFCMLIKTDGTGLYATKDIYLAYKKFEEYKLDLSIYIVDVRQALHFKQVFKVLEKINFPHAKFCHHLEYDFVELPNGAMSSRRGNIIPMTSLIDNMEKTIKEEFLNKYSNEWDQKEINDTATKIASGAIKYGMIRMDHNKKIVFEMKEWLKLEGETGPYLQYVVARINSISLKQNAAHELKGKIPWEVLIHPLEENLLFKISEFNSIAASAALNNKTPLMTSYLYELGKMYNSFYAECPIAKAEKEEQRRARLALSYAVGEVIKKGLALIGIECPLRM